MSRQSNGNAIYVLNWPDGDFQTGPATLATRAWRKMIRKVSRMGSARVNGIRRHLKALGEVPDNRPVRGELRFGEWKQLPNGDYEMPVTLELNEEDLFRVQK